MVLELVLVTVVVVNLVVVVTLLVLLPLLAADINLILTYNLNVKCITIIITVVHMGTTLLIIILPPLAKIKRKDTRLLLHVLTS